MRIRKRSQSVAPATVPLPLPISCKYQTAAFSPSAARIGAIAAECSNMQANRYPELQDHEPPVMDSLRLSDAHVKDEEDEDLSGPEETSVPDKARRRQSSPKRRKIEHESNLVFEGSASMTAAELLVVNELANGVRQRLHAASEHSATTEVTKSVVLSKPVENSKDALISSIFFVFGTCGENGLSASEVVKYMLEQRLPGLKEGGARHTVQVANVLRSSSSFISLGDKKYLLCSNLDVSRSKRQQQAHKSSPVRSPSPGSSLDSSENEDVSPEPKPRSRTPASKSPHSSRSVKKSSDVKAPAEVVVPADGEPVVVKTTRRRGPSSSQKGKGPTQCKRYDGRGWQCSRLTEPGYSLCVHHQDLINKRAAKLKEQQTLSRLMESSQHRKPSKSQQQQQQQQQLPPLAPSSVETPTTESRVTAPSSTNSNPPVQKRKMLSLLAIK